MSWKLPLQLERGVEAVTCHWRDFPTVQHGLSRLNRSDSRFEEGCNILRFERFS